GRVRRGVHAVSARYPTRCLDAGLRAFRGGAKGKRGVWQPPDAALIEAAWLFPYCRNLTVTSLEQVEVPAAHTLYVYLARPVSPVESVSLPVLGTVAIKTRS